VSKSDHVYPPDGLNALANGLIKPWMAKDLGLGLVGCAYRGSLVCLQCPWAPLQECDWNCGKCDSRALCKCGQTGQEQRIARALGLELTE
jgi:hypothetical protein